jgi:transcriptional regulator
VYMPAHFEVTDKAALHDVIVEHPLGTWIVSNNGELLINHIPFLLKPDCDTHGVLNGHVARANPVWKQLTAGVKSAVVFHAEQGYVSPSWYPSKQQNPGVVPTWNYAVVHVHGRAKVIEDKQWLLQHVSMNTRRHEDHRNHPWQVADAPAEYVDKLLAGIVGIEIQIETIQGKFKLSQNRPVVDQQGVVTGLQESGDPEALSLAKRMQQGGN